MIYFDSLCYLATLTGYEDIVGGGFDFDYANQLFSWLASQLGESEPLVILHTF